ncbi:MAG: hypothetical protein HY699_09465 [Deltaproteobacteria bacterium]|nr:hypothetical protein [Deltaproteobacteria bacterium]
MAVLALFYGLSYCDATGAFFHYDDYWVLSEAAAVDLRGPLDIVQFFVPGRNGFVLYRPLSTVVYFRLLHAAFGYDAAGYHAVQVLFHCLNGLLGYAIASTVLRSRLLGLAVALVYASAPGHAIAVFWMALFSMTGTAFFYLLCLCLWLRWDGRARLALCLPLFLAALGCGEHAVTLPVVLSLSVVLLEGRWPNRRDWLAQAPFYAVALAYAAAKLYYLRFVFPFSFPDPFRQAATLRAYGWHADPWGILDHLGRYAAFGFNLLFAVIDPGPPGTSWPITGIGGVVTAATVVAAVLARPGRRISAEKRAVAFGLALFAVALLPVLGLRDHTYGYYVGIAGLGLALAAVAALAALPRRGVAAAAACAGVVLLVHVGVTWGSARAQRDFDFLREFSRSAARWLYTVEWIADHDPGTRELVVARNPLTFMLFDDTGAHRLILPDVHLGVRSVEEVSRVEASPGRRTMSAPYVLAPGQPWPGSQRRWDWLRWPPVS